MRIVELCGTDRRPHACVEIPDVIPPFEFIRFRDRNFAWHEAEGKYVEASIFIAQGAVPTPRAKAAAAGETALSESDFLISREQ